AYTDLPAPQDLPPGTGELEAVNGTRIVLRAAADRPLRHAWIEYQRDNRLPPLAAFLGSLGGHQALGVANVLAASHALWARVPARFGEDQRIFTVDFYPRAGGWYGLNFEDETGLVGSRLLEMRLRPDPPPTVQLERPSPSRDVLAVLPDAELAV